MPLSEQYQAPGGTTCEAIPFVAAEKEFALKGGTAINLFVRDMPRLSVDIDLTYLPVAPRLGVVGRDRCCDEADGCSHPRGLRGVRVTEMLNARERS